MGKFQSRPRRGEMGVGWGGVQLSVGELLVIRMLLNRDVFSTDSV